MNSTFFSRLQMYFIGLISAAAIILVTTFSITLLCSCFHFIQTTIGATARQAGELVSYVH